VTAPAARTENQEVPMKSNSMSKVAGAFSAATLSAALGVATSGMGVAAHAQTAQLAAPPARETPAVPVQPKINLTLEQRHTVKELIKDLNVPSAPKNVETAVGTTVPAAVKLTPMPVLVAEKVPQIKSHLFFIEDGKVVIVDPKENKVVDSIE
jgi:hypothetical protein